MLLRLEHDKGEIVSRLNPPANLWWKVGTKYLQKTLGGVIYQEPGEEKEADGTKTQEPPHVSADVFCFEGQVIHLDLPAKGNKAHFGPVVKDAAGDIILQTDKQVVGLVYVDPAWPNAEKEDQDEDGDGGGGDDDGGGGDGNSDPEEDEDGDGGGEDDGGGGGNDGSCDSEEDEDEDGGGGRGRREGGGGSSGHGGGGGSDSEDDDEEEGEEDRGRARGRSSDGRRRSEEGGRGKDDGRGGGRSSSGRRGSLQAASANSSTHRVHTRGLGQRLATLQIEAAEARGENNKVSLLCAWEWCVGLTDSWMSTRGAGGSSRGSTRRSRHPPHAVF